MRENDAREYLLKILPLQKDITDDTNLIEAGLDSLSIMKLNSIWRKSGSKVTFTRLISKPFWGEWKKLLKFDETCEPNHDVPLKGASDESDDQAPFPLTEVQYAYWAGRNKNQTLGGFGCHCYVELDGGPIDTERLKKAWSLLLVRHPMLRVKFLDDGTQQYMDKPYNDEITVYDLRNYDSEKEEKELLSIRSYLSHRQFHIELGEVAGLGVALLSGERHRIFFDIDLLVADVHSFQVILNDLGALYKGTLSSGPSFHFGKYLRNEAERKSAEIENDRSYWHERLDDMPLAPKLPLAKEPALIKEPYFTARRRELPASVWSKLKEKTSEYCVTPSMMLLCAYGLAVANYSENQDFLINIPTFNRNTEIDGIENAVADFTRLSLLSFHRKSGESFIDTVRRTAADFYEMMEHSAYSGVDIIRALNKKYGQETPVAPVVFACNTETSLTDEIVESTLGKWNYIISQTPQVWLDFQMYIDHGSLVLKWDSVKELFDPEFLDLMFSDFTDFLGKLSESDWNSEILFRKHNLPAAGYNEDSESFSAYEIQEKFFENAVQHPDLTALADAVSGKTMTYSETAKAALGIAGKLRELGLHDEKIAVIMPRGIPQILSILGITASGNCYVPVNAEYPLKRQEYIFEKAGIRYALTDKKCIDKISDRVTAVTVDDISAAEDITEWKYSSPDSSAYVIFTSGSTGDPKGVEITHRGAFNTIRTVNEQYGLGFEDRVIAISAVDFDLSVYDIFGTLSAGACLIVLDDEHRKDAEFWYRTIKHYGVTFWNSVPAFAEMLYLVAKEYDDPLTSVRKILLSGDWIAVDLPARLKSVLPNAETVSLGGATEASIWSNYYDITLPVPENYRSIPYGRALKNQKYRIVDERLCDCPPYKKGELLIGGIGLAKGYTGDEKLTLEHFIYDNGERWYRTGDFGRVWADGSIEFLGRNDDQVKLNGYRIELGEIENNLNRLKEIRESKAVIISQNSGQILAAYICPENNAEVPDHNELRAYLHDKIPFYMIPNIFITIKEMPLNRNGKIDVKALKAIQTTVSSESVSELPEPGLETEIADEWKRLLDTDSVDRNTSFFELGGDSLTATALCMRLRKKYSLAIALDRIFEWKTIRLQAEGISQLKERDGQQADLLPAVLHDEKNRFSEFGLSDIQMAYWLGKKNDYSLSGISTVFYYELETGKLDMNILGSALGKLIRRHDMMRAIILKDEAKQTVLSSVPEYEIVYTDLEKSELSLEKIRDDMSHHVFDENVWPLFEFRVTRTPEDRMHLHMCFDNIIFDGFSIAILLDELGAYYSEPEKPADREKITFRDYLETFEKWKCGNEYDSDRKYWLEKVKVIAPPPELPLVMESDKVKAQCFSHLEERIPAAEYEKLKEKASAYGLTPTAVLLSAYAAVLVRWSRNSHFTLNMTMFNRIHFSDEVDQIVGDFTSLVLADMEFKKDQTLASFMNETQKKLVEDLSHPYYSGVSVIREYAGRHGIAGREVMPVVFTSALGFAGKIQKKNKLGRRVYNSSQTPQVWLDHQVLDDEDNLILSWDYVSELFPDGMIEDMFGTYVRLIKDIIANDHIWQSSRDYLTLPHLDERKKANDTSIPVSELTLKEMFDRNLLTGRDRTAVCTLKRNLTYGEIDDRAAAVAEKLLDAGVKKNTLVAVVMEKGWEQIVAAVAVHKSGAAYYPVDSSFPPARINELLELGEVKAVLTQSYTEQTWNTESYIVIDVDQCEKISGSDGSGRVTEDEIKAGPDDLAYVICTSGTTGMPKGVEITHRGAVNTITDINRRFDIGPEDSVIALSNLNFDLSVYDIFGMFYAGGKIIVPDADRRKEPEHWIELMEKFGVTVWNTVPMYMEMLVAYAKKEKAFNCKLKKVLMSGDWIAPSLPERMHELWGKMDVISLGGATEASIWSNYYVTDSSCSSMKSIPYGKPLSNQKFFVFDEFLQDRPVLVPGKLFIGGLGLARGYWKDETKTKEKFIYHPVTGERLYDTGDMGRYLFGGDIEFLGRTDTQVKIGGYRIELGEIESAFERLNGIQNSVVSLIKQNGTSQMGCSLILDEEGKKKYLITAEDSISALRSSGRSFASSDFNDDEQIKTRAFHKAMDALSMKLVIRFTDANGFDEDKIRDSLAPAYKKKAQEWKEMLLNDGLIEQYGKTFIWNHDPVAWYEKEASPEILNNTVYEKYLHEIRDRLEKYQDSWFEVMKGSREAVSFYLEEDGGLTPKAFGKYAIYDQKVNETAVKFAEDLCIGSEVPLKIMELGTRVEPLFEKMYPAFEAYAAEYVYVEESAALKEQVEKRVKKFKGFTVSEYDIENESSMSTTDFYADVIIANNTLHRRNNIDQVISSIGGLMKTDGILLLTEQVSETRFIRNVIGIYDEGTRNDLLLSEDKWVNLLERHDFKAEVIDSAGDMRVIAAVYKGKHEDVRTEFLKADIASLLPDYMIPQYYRVLDSYPVSSNGKVDRNKLSEFWKVKENIITEQNAEPETETEKQLQIIWKKRLDAERVGAEDTFFILGGDSLKAIQCINDIKSELGFGLTLRQMFRYQTIRQLAAFIDSQRKEDECETGEI